MAKQYYLDIALMNDFNNDPNQYKNKFPNLERGDIIRFTENGEHIKKYKNEGVSIWNGWNVVPLDRNIDIHGTVPREFSIGREFPAEHWTNCIDHNRIVHLDDDIYHQIELFYKDKYPVVYGNVVVHQEQYNIEIYTNIGKQLPLQDVREFLINEKPEIIVAYDKLLMCYYKPHLIRITI